MSGTLRRLMFLAAIAVCTTGVAASPAAAAKRKTVTKTATVSRCAPVGVTLPQFSPGNNSITRIPFTLGKLPKKAKIVDVDATLRVTTTRSQDLRVVLASPGGAIGDLINFRPGSGNNADLGTGPACAGTPTTLDDEASGSVGVEPPPPAFTGSFRPESPLSVMDGGPAGGEFVFFAGDFNQSSAAVTIDSVGATVTYSYKAKKKAKKTAGTAAKSKFRNGTKDVCVSAVVPLNNGNTTPQSSDDVGFFLQRLAIGSGKLPKKATVTDVDLRVRAEHTYPGDLDFYLSTPGGGIAAVWVGYDESLSNIDAPNAFGSGAGDCTGALATFDDEAALSSTTAVEPFGAATFQPTSPLSVLDGRQAGGTWTLWAEDKYKGDVGVLHAAGLHISYRYPAPVKKKKK